jgi:Transketolase
MDDKRIMNHAEDNIRILAASMVEKANSGHPSGAMGGADFMNVLFSEFLVYDPENPGWEGRDCFFSRPRTHVADVSCDIGADRQVFHGRFATIPPVGKCYAWSSRKGY